MVWNSCVERVYNTETGDWVDDPECTSVLLDLITNLSDKVDYLESRLETLEGKD